MAESLKTLQTLVRLSEKDVEDKQKALAQIRSRRDDIEQEKAQAKQKMQQELTQAHQSLDPQLQSMATAYQRRMLQQLEQLDERLSVVAHQEQLAADALQEAFSEQKRYEVLHEKAVKEAKRILEKKEQEQLDDMASLRQARKS